VIIPILTRKQYVLPMAFAGNYVFGTGIDVANFDDGILEVVRVRIAVITK
jgi:hypothetical protein